MALTAGLGGGQVYKGRNQETDEAVAIKEVSLSKIRRRSPEFAARHQQNLRNETECLRSLNHPNIVKLYGAPAPPRPAPFAAPCHGPRPPRQMKISVPPFPTRPVAHPTHPGPPAPPSSALSS